MSGDSIKCEPVTHPTRQIDLIFRSNFKYILISNVKIVSAQL
jgi:hypothetical protein